ncbi:hypothetical protein [Fluviispira vulneris]|uniref:hypothetical protein n=1 Tax=Fluviispira vulneris TaxID=2763012 RepID=UPI001646F690|nr:hypothetical protein [Fluviispira vulneris]
MTIAKILETLIEQLHKKMAEGHGEKTAKVSEELKEAAENTAESAEETEAPKENLKSKFNEWLQSENERKAKPKAAKLSVISIAAEPKNKKIKI